MKTIVKSVANEMRTVTEGETKHRFKTVGVILKFLHRKALSGDLSSKRFLDELRDTFSPIEVNSKGHGVFAIPRISEEIESLGLPIEDVEDFP